MQQKSNKQVAIALTEILTVSHQMTTIPWWHTLFIQLDGQLRQDAPGDHLSGPCCPDWSVSWTQQRAGAHPKLHSLTPGAECRS